MYLDLRQLFEVVDEHFPVEYDLDLSGYEFFVTRPFITPVAVNGLVKNVAGIVTLDCSVQFTLRLSCDRCLKEFERGFSEDFQHILVNRLESDDDLYSDYIVVPDMRLNLDELLTADIMLAMPSKFLCSEDCKGLCPQCGKDLNQGDCGGTEQTGDPRFDVLKQLLT